MHLYVIAREHTEINLLTVVVEVVVAVPGTSNVA